MRTIRVYDQKGDFDIEVPDDAKVTFGYFNPSNTSGGAFDNNHGFDGRGNVAKQTALRVYEKGEKSNQLACFIGVRGFRDTGIGITRLQEQVTIVKTYEDDGEGFIDQRTSRKALMKAVKEEDVFD